MRKVVHKPCHPVSPLNLAQGLSPLPTQEKSLSSPVVNGHQERNVLASPGLNHPLEWDKLGSSEIWLLIPTWSLSPWPWVSHPLGLTLFMSKYIALLRTHLWPSLKIVSVVMTITWNKAGKSESWSSSQFHTFHNPAIVGGHLGHSGPVSSLLPPTTHCQLQEIRDFCLFCSRVWPQHLAQCI